MDVGLSVTSSIGGPPAGAVREVLKRVRAATRAELAHLTFGDHHAVGPTGQYLQGVPMLARALAEWPSSRPAGLLFLVPLWHPVHMAEQIGTLATIHDGPLIVQIGLGAGGSDFDAFGVDPRRRGRLADRAIPLVKALLAGEIVSDDTFGISNAAIGPRPAGFVEWWVGAGNAPAAIDRAAREGTAWYVGPRDPPGQMNEAIDVYRSRCGDHGTEPRLVVRRDVLVCESDADGIAMGDELIAKGYRGMSREALVCGGVERVTELLAPWHDLGASDIVARTPDVPFAVAERSIELLGQVRTSLGAL